MYGTQSSLPRNLKGLCALLSGLFCLACAPATFADGYRILATGGVTDVEGSAGGGITPWEIGRAHV